MVAERLGHADPAITLRLYAHVIRKSSEGVAATFSAAVTGETDDDDLGDDDPDGAAGGGVLASPLANPPEHERTPRSEAL